MKVSIGVIIVIIFFFASCHKQKSLEPHALSLNEDFPDRFSEFSFEFLEQVEHEEATGNYMVSPISLFVVLGMLLNGTEGSSKEELLNTLNLKGLSSGEINEHYRELILALNTTYPGVRNTMANSLWYEHSFDVNDNFKNTLVNYFKADLKEEDFSQPETVQKVNQWASDHTNGLINQILHTISPDEVLFLINALYFKADWTQAFDSANTYKTNFHGKKETGVASMMVRKDSLLYHKNEAFEWLSLPYASGQYEMHIVLPLQGKPSVDIVKALSQGYKGLRADTKKQMVELQLPQFTIAYKIKLNEVVKRLGAPSLFSSSADLSQISPPAGALQVGFIQQDTYIKLDEQGTEAAATTTIGIELTSLPSYPVVKCNRPFFFIITEKESGVIQFLGRINNL